MYYFSASKNAFYHSDIHGTNIPEDSVTITDKEHDEIFKELNTGKVLASKDGYPVAETKVITITWDAIRTRRNKLLANCDFTQLIDFPGNKEAWATYRQLLRDIPQLFKDPTEVVWPTAPKTNINT